jgi:hypothetical protein
MSALKNASHDGDDSGDEAQDEKTAEEDDWMKTFESMKRQYMSKVEVPVVKSEKFVKRQNVALIEVMLKHTAFFVSCRSLCRL